MTDPRADSFRWQLLRQLLHFASGAGAFLLIWYPAWVVGLALLAGAGIAAAASAHPMLGRLFRPGEGRLNGATWYALGVIATLILLPAEAAFAGWIVLAAGDSAATVVGQLYPIRRLRGGRRSIGGSVAFFVVSILCLGAALAVWKGSFGDVSMPAVFLASGAAAIIEIFAGRIQDNLVLPLLSGAIYLAAS